MPTSREFLAFPVHLVAACSLAIVAAFATGCAGTGSGVQVATVDGTGNGKDQSATAPLGTPARAANEQASLVAMLDGQAIEWSELRAPIAELAGQQVLRDAVLDIRLARRLREQSIAINGEQVAREETILLEALSPDRTRAVELLGVIRQRQGLGSVRFAALLKRNAGLRALVARDVRIDEVGIANAFDMLHGTKRVARLAVLTSLPDAERFIADVQAGRSFIDLAVERSLDDGAARGGLLAPIARRDPSYPEGLRAAIYATNIGGVSAPILENGRFFVVTVMEERPSDGTTLESARARCEEVVRRSQERLLMDALARELSELKGVTVFDRSFDPPNK